MDTMDALITVFLGLLIMIMFIGYALGKPDVDDIFVGSKSGYTCVEIKPSTQLGEEARCAIYKLEESDVRR